MVAPIKGWPLEVQSTPAGPGSRYMAKQRTTQAKPYTLPLPYLYRYCKVSSDSYAHNTSEAHLASDMGNFNAGCTAFLEQAAFCSDVIDRLRNKAREKLLSEFTPSAMAAVNYYERKQALESITSRLAQFANIFAALLRKDVKGAFRHAGMDPKRYGKQLRRAEKHAFARRFGNSYLEFHFGLEPLYNDVHAAIAILEKDPGPVTLKARTTEPFSVQYTDSQYYDQFGGYYDLWSSDCSGRIVVKVGATLSVSNPMAYRASQLGLVNPFALLYEATPFSFIVDWFTNIGQWINSFTDLTGIAVESPYVVTVIKASGVSSYLNPNLSLLGGDTSYSWRRVASSVIAIRTLGFPGVTLQKPRIPALTPTKALVLTSLLTGLLPKHTKNLGSL